MLRLEAFDTKLASGVWTDHDSRTYGGLSNNLRLTLRELNVKGKPAVAPPSLVDYLAVKAASR
jgi:hypothetical protein